MGVATWKSCRGGCSRPPAGRWVHPRLQSRRSPRCRSSCGSLSPMRDLAGFGPHQITDAAGLVEHEVAPGKSLEEPGFEDAWWVCSLAAVRSFLHAARCHTGANGAGPCLRHTGASCCTSSRASASLRGRRRARATIVRWLQARGASPSTCAPTSSSGSDVLAVGPIRARHMHRLRVWSALHRAPLLEDLRREDASRAGQDPLKGRKRLEEERWMRPSAASSGGGAQEGPSLWSGCSDWSHWSHWLKRAAQASRIS